MAAHAPTRPQPLLTRAGIVTAISLLSALLVHTNHGTVSHWLNVNADLIAGFVLAVGPVVTAFLAHQHVTPLADPVDANGNQLVPVDQAQGVNAASVLAAAISAAEAILQGTTAEPAVEPVAATDAPVDPAPTDISVQEAPAPAADPAPITPATVAAQPPAELPADPAVHSAA